jgi:hypothetical protein
MTEKVYERRDRKTNLRIRYSYSRWYKKWNFKLPNHYEFLTASPNGVQGARTIANILFGSLKRNPTEKTVDNLARGQVSKLFVN